MSDPTSQPPAPRFPRPPAAATGRAGDGRVSHEPIGHRSRWAHSAAVAVVLRPARCADAAFLTEMLVEAAFWRPGGPRGRVEDVLGRPELAHYVAGWSRPGDLGVVAEAGHPVGAAWLRYFLADDPGYGFVDAGTPEVALGVVPAWRGRGVGGALLDALIAGSWRAGHVAVLRLRLLGSFQGLGVESRK